MSRISYKKYIGGFVALSVALLLVLAHTSSASTYSIFDDSTPADTTAPTISITAPTGGSTISGSASLLTVSASDDTGVVGVQFMIDNANLNGELLNSPFTSTFDTNSVSNGTHTLIAVARDAAGNYATSTPVVVTVNNVSTPAQNTGSTGGSSGGSSSSSGSSGGSSGGSGGSPLITGGSSVTPTTYPTIPVVVTHANITGWIYLGVTDPQVKIIQQVLNANGFVVAFSGAGSRGNESTYFGPATLLALEKFQCAKLAVCSGSADTTGYGATGPRTRTALNALGITGGGTIAATVPVTVPIVTAQVPVGGSITAWLYQGVTHYQVKTLQQILNTKGYQVALSGSGSPGNESTYFGSLTSLALKKFQCAKLAVCSGDINTTGYGATGPRTRAALNSQ